MSSTTAKTVVCRLSDIPDGEARGFEVGAALGAWGGFVVRRGEGVYAYVNRCPHADNALNWKPDAFLTRDKSLIMCSAHGAIFEISTGFCVGGPCRGRALTKIDARVEQGDVVVYYEEN